MADGINETSVNVDIPTLDPGLNQILEIADPRDVQLKHFLITVQMFRNLLKQDEKMSAQLDALTQQVSQNTTVIESAITLIDGFSKRLSDGIAAAQAGDLSKLTDLQTELAAEDAKLAAAVAANTPDTGSPAAPNSTPTDAPAASDPTASTTVTASATGTPTPSGS